MKPLGHAKRTTAKPAQAGDGVMIGSRFHTPTFENHELPEGYAACLSCGEAITIWQLEEPCPKSEPADG